MFFRKFSFVSSSVTTIDTLLASLPSPPPQPAQPPSDQQPPPSDSSSPHPAPAPPTTSTFVPPADVALYETTLDSLLATPDLLSEIKAGANTRLNEFLARAEVINRLGGWVVWGLGGEQEENGPNNGIISDDVEDGKVPDLLVAPGEKKKEGMGGVPRRRDMDEMGVLEGGEPESDQEKSWAAFPRLATEILASDTPSLAAILCNPSTLTPRPDLAPTPKSFLEPFWEALLRSTELQLETRSVQVGYWARINGVLLGGPHGAMVLSHLLHIPNLLPRLLTLLPNCSPINDLLLLILRVSTPPSPILTSLVPATLRMLDPYNSLGKQGHISAEELLRGVIELCSAASTGPAVPPQGGPAGGPPGSAPLNAPPVANDGPEWRENGLARQLADGKAVKMMVEWMLAEIDLLAAKEEDEEKMEAEVSDEVPISPPADEATPKVGIRQLPTPPGPSIDDLRTSSLVQSISVLVDLIRKNNSDFVEQQMLTWARRMEQEDADRLALEAEGAQVVESTADPESGSSRRAELDKGPSLVDLGALLTTVANRMKGFQMLIQKPRSLRGPILTSAGSITPLTQERFRICEFYAELLHCSNMSLLNRPTKFGELYDKDGYLAQGWRAADALAEAISGSSADGEERDLPPLPPSFDPDPPPYGGDTPLGSFSGISTPSAQGSLDSESGVLSRAEAKELRDIVAAARGSSSSSTGDDEDSTDESDDPPSASSADGDDDDEDPFGDPVETSSDADLAEATEAIQLNSNLDLRSENLHSSPDSDEPPSPTPITSAIPPSTEIPSGQLLKRKFMEHRVIPTVLDLFFDYPWNNFLHNVVFDIIQQIFHGRIDRTLDRQLALSVFLDGRLIDRILEGEAANEAATRAKKARLGYMGHMILIAEEVVKLFEHYPEEIFTVIEPHIPQPAWDRYVATTLRETRERDLSPLGGGVSVMPHDIPLAAGSSLSDEDDEFPMNSTRALKALIAGGPGPVTTGSPPEGGVSEVGPGDEFSRYLATAMSSDRPADDDDEEGWLGGSRFDPGDVDFALSDAKGPTTFGFDDRFDSAGERAFRESATDSDDDTDWGPFATDSSTPRMPADDFRPTVASTSSAAFGFESSFSDAPFDNFVPTLASSSAAPDDDDFGDFESAQPTTVSLAALEDFDFDEDKRSSSVLPNNSTLPLSRPEEKFARTASFDDGSNHFGGLSSSFDEDSRSEMSPSSSSNSLKEESPKSIRTPRSLPPLSPPLPRSASFSPPTSPSVQADLATSLEEPLGPNVHEGSHLTSDGFVETTLNGKVVRVPADEIALAHRRSSSESERPVIERPLEL
ncbi:SAPS-domain-containing protein [Meredithblackwellia eburnea MCA 4105]